MFSAPVEAQAKAPGRSASALERDGRPLRRLQCVARVGSARVSNIVCIRITLKRFPAISPAVAIAIEPHKTVHWRAKVYRSPEHDSMPHWRAHRKEQSARRTAARTGSDGEEKHGPGRKRQRTTAQAPATGNMGGIAPDMSPFASPWLPLIQGLGSRWPNGAGGAMSAATVGAPGMGGAAPLPLPPLLPLPLLGSAGPQAFTAGLPGIAPMSWMPMPMPVAPSLLVTEAVPPAGAEGRASEKRGGRRRVGRGRKSGGGRRGAQRGRTGRW